MTQILMPIHRLFEYAEMNNQCNKSQVIEIYITERNRTIRLTDLK